MGDRILMKCLLWAVVIDAVLHLVDIITWVGR
jgi:hypothetical protein